MNGRILMAACAAATLVLGAPGALAQGSGLASADTAAPAMKVATPDFAKAAAGSNMFEIRSSEMAREKATSAEVKRYAAMMIEDHETAQKGLRTAVGDKMKGSPSLAPKQAAMLKQLEAAPAAEFQTLYVDMQAKAHMEAVALFRTYSGNGDDATVQAFAKETLPKLEHHLEMVQKIVATM